jgi:hypothetical protein
MTAVDDHRFDNLVRKLGTGANRRTLLRGLFAGGAAVVASGATLTQAAPKDKVSICHRQGGSYALKQVNGNAYDAHIAHGDFDPYICVDGPSCEECPIVDVGIFNCGPGIACPTGATTFFPVTALDPTSSEQARLACEACYGECFLNQEDCAGPAWGPDRPENFQCGPAQFLFQSGCGAVAGTAFRACNSSDVYGYWGDAIC